MFEINIAKKNTNTNIRAKGATAVPDFTYTSLQCNPT